jgi:hypothetical protein
LGYMLHFNVVVHYNYLAQQIVVDSETSSSFPTIFFFLVCTLYKELWQCCVFTNFLSVTCSPNDHIFNRAVVVVTLHTVCLWKQWAEIQKLEKQFLNNRVSSSNLKFWLLDVVSSWQAFVCFKSDLKEQVSDGSLCILPTLAAGL